MSSIVVARDVSYSVPNGRELFNHLHFSLDAGVTALVGPNGVGKTCLANILAGALEPTAGTVQRNAAVRLFPQREKPEPIAVAEYLSAEYEWSRFGERLLADLDRRTLCNTLSGGEWARVRLARVLADGYLVLDEPTNDLDRDGRAVLAEFLRERVGGVLLISHDRECLELCAEVLELSNRGLEKFGRGWSAYAEAKERERDRQSAALERANRERDAVAADRVERRARQEKRNRRGAAAAARGGTPRILLGARKQRAQVSTGALDAAALARVEGAVRDTREALAEMKIEPVMYADLLGGKIPAQKLVAEAIDFNIRFGNWLYAENVSFSWQGNVRVAVGGPNGSGKSTLLKAVLGAAFQTRGTLRRGELAALYIDQALRSLDDDKSVIDNVRAVCRTPESEIRNGLAKFLFVKDAVFRRTRDLSGGERLRAALAQGFLSERQPDLLILDEPTNNLDLVNVEFLEHVVREFPGPLVVVSHDERFVANCGVSEELALMAAAPPRRE